MDRKRKLYVAKTAAVMGILPALLWAYEYGPDPGYVGVPGENGGATCATSGCHTGTANSPSNKGSVAVSFPNGASYSPGVKQHLTVTISDPATSQKAWGFQLTARAAGSPSAMAGSFASTDNNTQLMCSQPNLFVFRQVPYSASAAQTCPSGYTLQYMEHSLAGYTASLGQTGSFSYGFDWTPPATAVGNITIYVAGNAGVGNPPTATGDHIYATTVTVTNCPAGGTPSVSAGGILNGASYALGQAVAPGSLVSIFGANLSPGTAIASSVPFPATLGCASVNVNGVAAALQFVSHSAANGDQINAQVPWEAAGSSSAQVVVTSSGLPSSAASVPVAPMAPGIFTTNGGGTGQAIAYNNSDGTFAAQAGSISGLTTRPAKIGDASSLVILATGLGAVTPTVTDGAAGGSTTLHNAVTLPVVTVGNVQAQVVFAGLSPQFPGVNQINIVIASGTPTGNAIPLQIKAGGITTSSQVTIAVSN
jgi:uncharacterized protein (TIGR03437 family)